MTTLPPEPAPASDRKPHEAREIAESFGADPERYDRARPRYPDALVARIVAASPGRDVLDVGCGTGIAARQFQAAGCTVLGIEPDPRMAEFARRTGVDVELATFETWDSLDRSFDAVIAGQAWHWVDQIAGAAKAARVLRPGGRLAVFGHVFDAPPEVSRTLTAAMKRVRPDSPFTAALTGGAQPARSAMDIYQLMFASAAEGMRRSAAFDEPEQWQFDWEHSYTRDEWLDLLPTTGALTQLAPDKLAVVLNDVGAAIDRIGGGFTMTYATLAATAVRTA